MKPIFILLSTVFIITGCVSIPEPSSEYSPFVYPNSGFENDEIKSEWAGLEEVGITNHTGYARVLAELLSDSDQFTLEERYGLEYDPFLTTPNIHRVSFMTFDPAQWVAKHYEIQFKKHGWKEVRGILIAEQGLGGGDWLKVYQKEKSLVRVHAMGRWKRNREEKQSMKDGSFSCRFIHLSFLKINPPVLLGSNYKEKKLPDPSG